MEMNKKVPALRFPEFREAGEWEEKELTKFSACGLSNGVFNDPKKVGTGYKLINVLDMYIDTVIDEEKLSLVELSKDEFLRNKVENGDIFFTRSSLVKPGIAYSNIYLGNSNDITFDGHLIRFRPNKKIILPIFANYLLRTNKVRTQLVARGKTATMTTIGQADVGNVKLSIPHIEEQQKIAACLSSLDELITAQAQKVEALKTHKKGLMQQLFPAEGETMPKLRFPEFREAGEWEVKAFGNLGLDISDGNYSSKYPNQSDFIKSGVPFLRANNLKFGTVSDEDMRFISREQHNQITKGHLKKDDILISTRGELGIIALVPDRHIGSNINAQIVRINTGDKLINTFLFQLLDYSKIIGLFDALSSGTALKQLPIGKLNQLNIPIPKTKEEQQKIAACLSSLDELITAQAQKVEALKTHKKGLMQQLFPANELGKH